MSTISLSSKSAKKNSWKSTKYLWSSAGKFGEAYLLQPGLIQII